MAPRINIPPLTRGLLAGLLFCTLLNAAARYRAWVPTQSDSPLSRQYYAPFLLIVPGSSIIYPWVFVTAPLAEQNIFGLLITGATLFYGGRYLERAWSSVEYAKFIALVTMIPSLATFAVYIILFAVTRNADLASTGISGGIAIQAAFLVSFKQLVPEHTVSLAKGLVRMRVKHFPAIFLVANTISGLALGTETAMLLAWFGFCASWTYLRFYRISPSSVTTATGESSILRGDASDTFAFAYFFPDVIHEPVAAIADIFYSGLVAVRLCTPFSAEDIDAGNEQASARGEAGLPSLLDGARATRGSARRDEAERRRALALKALDQRLQTVAVRPNPGTEPDNAVLPDVAVAGHAEEDTTKVDQNEAH